MRKVFQLAGLLLIALCPIAASPPSVPPNNAIINLGWIRVVEQNDGWLVTNVYQLPPARETLRSGDVIVGVGTQRIGRAGWQRRTLHCGETRHHWTERGWPYTFEP